MTSRSLLALTVLVLALTAAATARKDGRLGGYQPIKNISDPHVKEIAKFAVSEYNKKAQAQNKLVLESVVRGDTQVVAGINYRLVISAKNVSVSNSTAAAPPGPVAAATANSYEAIVWEKAWEHFRQLISFSIAKK